MPDGSILLNCRYCTVPLGWRSSSWFSSQSVVDGSSLTVPAPVSAGMTGDDVIDSVVPAGKPGTAVGAVVEYGDVMFASWNLQSAVAKASAFSVFVLSVLRWIISENELPSSWVRRLRPGVRAR